MTSNTPTAPATRRSSVPVRIGLVLGAVLSALQISTGVGLWRAEGFSVGSAALIAVPIVALVAIVFAWRGSFPARVVTVVACLVPALMGLPAYFIPDIPPARGPRGLDRHPGGAGGRGARAPAPTPVRRLIVPRAQAPELGLGRPRWTATGSGTW